MIVDPAAPAVEQVRRLRTRAYRQKTGQVIVEGCPEVRRALRAGIPVDQLFFCPEILTPTAGEFDHLPMKLVSKEVFAAMAFGSRLKGILAICRPEKRQLMEVDSPAGSLIVVLEAVEKPGNLGAVLRSADGGGVTAVIICDGKTDIYNQHVVRSSIGAVFTVPVVDSPKEDALAYLRARNFAILVASARAEEPYTSVDMRANTAIIVGNEHTGVSDFWSSHCDRRIRIPLEGDVTSLNVTVSASILIYEALRQKSC